MQSPARIAVLAALLLAAAPLPRAPRDEIELRWRGHAGDVLRLRMTMTQHIENSMIPEPVESLSAFVFRQEVKEVSEDGVGSLELEYEGVRMETDGPMAMEYDSTLAGEDAKRNDPRLAALFRPMLDATVRLKMDPSGRVSEITGLKEALEDAFDSLDVGGQPGMGEAFKQMFGDDALRRMVEVNVFPDGKLAPGDRWERSMEIAAPMLGTMKLVLENELVGVETRGGTDCARVAVSGEIELDAEDNEQMEISLTDTDISGTMYFALENGFLVEAEMENSMDMAISVESGGMELEMKMEMAQRTVRLGEDDPLFE